MKGWSVFAAEDAELATAVEARLTATKHHVLATLRRDGSPRLSGTEVQFLEGGLYLGMMPGSRKARDLDADPRYALHANPGDGSMEGGDAKLSGSVRALTDGELGPYRRLIDPGSDGRPFVAFVAELDDVVLTEIHPDGDRLVITHWHAATGTHRTERR